MTTAPEAPAALTAAVEVFRAVGWADATDQSQAGTLPIGTPEQQRVAKAGLATGEWGHWGPIESSGSGGGQAYGWTSWTGVDRVMLTLFAVRVGVDARRAVALLSQVRVDADVAVRVVAGRGEAFTARIVAAAVSGRLRGPLSDAVVRLVDHADLPLPETVAYLEAWTQHAWRVLVHEGGRSGDEVEIVRRRLPAHLDAVVATGLPDTALIAPVVRTAVEHGWLGRDAAVALVLSALDTAQRPGGRKDWVRLLTGPLAVTDAELLLRADALVGVLAHGDAPVIEAIGPRLVAVVDEGTLGDLLAVTLPIRTKKVLRLLLLAAADRPRPSGVVVEAVAPLVLPHVTGTDRTLARAAAALADAWGIAADPAAEPGPAPARGLWQPTPPVWDVPRFETGEVSAAALTEAAAVLTGRPAGVVDVEVERFLALATAVAWTDLDAARSALGGVRPTEVGGLRCVAPWLVGERSWQADLGPRDQYGSRTQPPLAAREGAVMPALGSVPVLLSTPTWVDLRIDPADLVARLRAHADAGVAAIEADLYLALLRCDLAGVTPEVLAALGSLDVPVRLQSGATMPVAAGPAARAYLTDPVREPALEPDPKYPSWRTGALTIPASLEVFPPRLRQGPYDTVTDVFPAWGDVASVGLGWSGYPEGGTGLALRQAVRRAAPLPPGLAVNLIGAQRGLHPAGAADGARAVLEAWERGLLRPGVADVRLLDWAQTPGNLAALARACGELATDGLLSVVWPLLDDVVLASVRERRMIAGTAEVVETMLGLLPEVVAAVAAGTAEPSVLDLPGARALAERPGSSRAVTLAQALTSPLPAVVAAEPVPVAAAQVPAGPPFEEVWPARAGRRPAVVDGATVTASWADPADATKMVAVDIDLPDDPGGPFRVVKGWFYDLEHEGQCAATSPAARAATGGGARVQDVWLRWDADAGRLTVGAHRDWRTGRDAPLSTGSVPPLTTSMVAVLLAALCHDAPEIYHQRQILGSGLVGSAAVTVAVRALLDQPVISPARMVRPIDGDAALLPVLWPVLVESVRHAAAQAGGLPRWLNRVLDTALLHAPALREAASRGWLPADQASWPGLAEIAGRKGSSAALTKARALREALGLG